MIEMSLLKCVDTNFYFWFAIETEKSRPSSLLVFFFQHHSTKTTYSRGLILPKINYLFFGFFDPPLFIKLVIFEKKIY